MERKYLKNAKAEKLTQDSPLSLGMNRIKDGKYYEFSARLDGALPETARIFVCHGYMISYGRWIEISERELKICSFTAWANPQLSERVYEHGLTVKNFINLKISYDTENGDKEIVLTTEGGTYTMGSGHFSCCDGEIMAKVEGVELYDASLGFSANGYSHDIWIIGASYLSLGDPARWPYYWYADGGAGPLLVGRGGMGAQHGIADFKDALNYGTPKLLVWDSVSGNNPDRDDILNPLFYENTLEMLKICKEKGIKVYIQTMPNCPLQTNAYKNDMILNRTGEFKNYDYEVIDLARALSARDEKNSPWFGGMLYTDNVHPTRLGGRASYLAIACDAPELIVKKACNVYSSNGGKLSDMKSGDMLTVSLGESIKNEQAITFRADFDGELSGTVTLGCDNGTFIAIDKENVTICAFSDGKEKTLASFKNPVITEKLINVKIHVKGSEALVSLASAGERDEPTKSVLDSFKVNWKFDGNVFAKANDVSLTDARIKVVTV